MNILSLDFGLERIGYAVGAKETGIAFPRKNMKNDKTLFNQLKEVIQQENIEQVIIGNPKRSNPYQISIITHIEKFIDDFEEVYPNIPCEFVDERYTTKVAEERLHQMGFKSKDQKDKVDTISAQLILQDYFDNTLNPDQ